ncbi:MAG TPA: hypothetical protein VEL76_08850 [Gemmataceae bacterium]|nr:hypothetical protein [Gemmataceae bacterium]
MSRLVIAVTGQVLWNTGDVRLWIELDLLLKDNAGGWKKHTFRLDSGTDLTTFPANLAKQLNLPLPSSAASVRHKQTGLEIRSGLLRFQIAGMDATEYVVACLFLGDPDVPTSGKAANVPRKLLQPLALLDRLRFQFDKNATLGAPHGEMIIEKK